MEYENMSHMTEMDTTVKLKNTEALLDALGMLQGMFEGLTFSHDQTAGQIKIKYEPIQVYQKENMSLRLKVDTWKINGDPYRCTETYNKIVDQIQVFYQASLAKVYTSRNKYSHQIRSVEQGKLMMRAMRY
jgi:hypothetical protein